MTRFFKPAAIVPILAAGAVLVAPIHLEPEARRALAIATWMVLSWILESIHPAIVGFTGCFLFVAAHVAEFDVAFGGFGTETPWFLYGALMLVSAARTSGAVRRIAEVLPPVSFLTASAVLVAVGAAAGALIDAAIARGVILVVAALAFGDRLMARQRANGTLPLVAVASYAAAVLGADGSASPSIAWRVVTVVVVIAVAGLLVRPAEEASERGAQQDAGAGPVLALLALTVVAWATTRLHGVSPAPIGLAAGLAAAFPGLKKGKGPLADPIALILAGAALSVPLVLEHTKAAGIFTSAAFGSFGAYWQHVVAGLYDPNAGDLAGVPPAKLALYQSPALILGAAVAGVRTRDVIKFGAAIAVAGALVVLVA